MCNDRNLLQHGLSFVLTLVLVVTIGCGGSKELETDPEKGVSVGTTAGIGALLGLGLGGGLSDVIGGAAVGAAGGMIANLAISESEKSKQRKAQLKHEEQDRQARKRYEEEERVANEAISKLIAAVGIDNVEGYKALRNCNHERAYALARAARTSSNLDYRITSYWLEAMTAVDMRDSKTAAEIYDDIVRIDPDIDTVQQASIETDKAVLDLRSERRELGFPRCR